MYDLAVIGAGWAGFNAALRARELNKQVCLIEKNQLGGVCLNSGCIPTKVLLQQIKSLKDSSKFNPQLFQETKNSIIKRLKDGMASLLKSSGVDFIVGTAKITSNNSLIIKETNQQIQARFILIAVGSEAKDLDFLRFDHQRIISSDDILRLDNYPKRLLIVGGGIISCELASALSNLGVRITIVEILDRLLSNFDSDISNKIEQIFKKKSIIVKTNYDVRNENLAEYDLILHCVGRIFNPENISDSTVEIKLNQNGFIRVDDFLRTSCLNIYAAGDCIGGYQLAHVARFEAIKAVDNMFLLPEKINYSAIPMTVFTEPEVAEVGLNEKNARSQAIEIKVIKKPFSSIGMAHILNQADGYLKLIISDKNKQILGASVIGPLANELINTLALVVAYKLKTNDLKNLVFAHPSISEIFTEALH